jgi:F-type H+-transporting ATPase subunit c
MGLSLISLFAPLLAAAEGAGGTLGVNGLLAVGVGIVVLGAAKGIGAIAASAVEAIARQPEAGGRIFTSMIISAALIEGFTFFALVICMIAKQ